MRKYLLILITSLLMFFSGCGGGGSDKNVSLDTLSNTQNISVLEQSLRNAGYTGASDVAELGTDTIAFTYFHNGNKHFVVYNNKEGKILSDIPRFIGSSITSNTQNTITFDNNTKVTIDKSNYKKVPVITTVQTRQTSAQIIKDRLGDRFQSFTYTKNREGAFVYAASEDYEKYYLYLYGLEDPSNPRQERILRTYTMHYHFHGLEALDGGRVALYERDGNSPQFQVIYDYIHNKEISNGFDSISSQESTRSPQEIITQTIEADQLHTVSHFTYTPQRGGAALVISTPGGRGIYFYDLDDSSYSTRYPIFESDDDSVVTDITMIGGRLLTYTYYEKMDRDKKRITITYDFIARREVSSSSSGNSNTNGGFKIGSVYAGDNKYISMNETIYISASGLSGLDGGLSYRWTDSNGNTLSTSQGFNYRGASSGKHTLYLKVTDKNANYATDYVEINVNETSSNSESSSFREQFKDDIDNFEWSYVSHAISPQEHGAIVLATSDAGYYIIYLYGISGDGTVMREKELVYENASISNLRMLSGGRFSYQIRGRIITKSYI